MTSAVDTAKVPLKLREYAGNYECQCPKCRGQEEAWLMVIPKAFIDLPGVQEKLKETCQFLLEQHKAAFPCLWGDCNHG